KACPSKNRPFEQFTMNGFRLIPEYFSCFSGLILESKSNPSFPASKIGGIVYPLVGAGFGTAGAYAQALRLKEDVASLKLAVKEMYGSDEYMSKLAASLSNIPSKNA
ncbi:MAG: hypothetical protein JWN41_1771, partial [Thermoleophilia bacterium]|nr:hypothetical protein [Thermoleophilia bacterium]